MVQSMTGFAVQTPRPGDVSLHLELPGVNSRYLDLGFPHRRRPARRRPRSLKAHLRASAAAAVECRRKGRPRRAVQHGAQRALLDQLVAGRTACVPLPDAAPLSVNELLRWPGMLADDNLASMLPAIVELTKHRARRARRHPPARGRQARRHDPRARRTHARARRQAAPRMPAVVLEYQERLTAKLRDAVASLDEDRVRQEVALYAQRIDVDEELTCPVHPTSTRSSAS